MSKRTLRRLRRLAAAVIASSVAWLVGEAYVGKPSPGFDTTILQQRLQEDAILRSRDS